MAKTGSLVKIFLFSLFVFPALLLAASTPSGQLTFSLQSAGPPIQVAAQPEAVRHTVFLQNLTESMNSGPAALELIRRFDTEDNTSLINTVIQTVERAVDPESRWEEFYDFVQAPENAWALPIVEYTLGNESDEEQIYVTVNRELRDTAPDSEMVSSWTRRMREAMWRLPRYEGISFRGTRLRPDQIERYYPVAQQAVDLAFISTSLSPGTAFKFAHLNPAGDSQDENEKIALVFVVIGKTGRPVSNFAHGHSHEQEILFANGTPMTVLAKTPIFQDSILKNTQIILVGEN